MKQANTPGTTVEFINDLLDHRATTWSTQPRDQVIAQARAIIEKSDGTGALGFCAHVHLDRIALHFYAVPGREDEAMADLLEGGLFE